MKKFIIISIVCLAVFAAVVFTLQRFETLRYELANTMANEKAALAEVDSLKDKSIEYQYTIDQLNYSNDSIVNKLNDARKELKIKDKKLKELAYIASIAKTVDTVTLRDTIFKYKDFQLDTTIGDKWYICELGLKYPNIITVSPEFKSEKSIVLSTKRETIYPPKKCWLGRLFQKKHTLVEVNIVEGSPYIETTESKFIQVIK